jgi:hypothetical protein
MVIDGSVLTVRAASTAAREWPTSGETCPESFITEAAVDEDALAELHRATLSIVY